jgi:hypothetical protein
VLAGVIEVEGSDRALFESVFKDIPQPYSTVHDDVDKLRFPQPHPSRFRMDLSTEFHRIGLSRDGNYSGTSSSFLAIICRNHLLMKK